MKARARSALAGSLVLFVCDPVSGTVKSLRLTRRPSRRGNGRQWPLVRHQYCLPDGMQERVSAISWFSIPTSRIWQLQLVIGENSRTSALVAFPCHGWSLQCQHLGTRRTQVQSGSHQRDLGSPLARCSRSTKHQSTDQPPKWLLPQRCCAHGQQCWNASD